MPKNVMKMLKPSPNYGRNDIDLSHRTVYAANFGELVPGFFIETVPKDKFKVRVSDLVRAQPMVTSPFLRAKQHMDVWFVPYNMMWSRFNEFISDKDEPSSSAFNDRLFVPSINAKAIYDALDDIDSNNIYDITGRLYIDSITRNLDLFGFAGTKLYTEFRGGSSHYPNLRFNLWRILAYNLIWYREYRQQYYDDGKFLLPSSLASLSNGASFLFNMDALKCDTLLNSALENQSYGNDLLIAMMQPRYRLWKKDIYTGLMPNSQFGNVSMVETSLPKDFMLEGNASMASQTLTTNAQSRVTAGSGVTFSMVERPSSPYTQKSTFDILTLRKREAIQKWRENALRAGNQIEDNFQAHYGVKPASHLDVHPKHIASFDAPLNIGDINAQAQTGSGANQSLGDVAGKGIMSFGGNDEFTFETNDFGVIVGIYSILPEAEYNGNNYDRMNCLLEREDYFFPEYENLGLELVDSTVISANSQYNFGLGYAPRYFGYKQKHDRCVGNFEQFQGFNGLFRQWCSPKFDVDDAVSLGQLPLSTLYVDPYIFTVNFNFAPTSQPQFLVDLYVDCEAIRQMSISGMPSY